MVSCSGDGLRYAFVLERGQIDRLPTHVDYPFLEGNRLVVRVAFSDNPVLAIMDPPLKPIAEPVDDQTLVNRGVGAFLKVFDDIQLREDAAARLAAQGVPDIVLIDPKEFNQRVAELTGTPLVGKSG